MSNSSRDRFTWGEGDLFVVDPETGEEKRLGDIPEEAKVRLAKEQRPITAGDLAAATRGLKIDRMAQDELRGLAERYEARPEFAARVVARAARERLKKVTAG